MQEDKSSSSDSDAGTEDGQASATGKEKKDKKSKDKDKDKDLDDKSKGKKVTVWFDDTSISKAQRTWRSSVTKLEAEYAKETEALKAIMLECQSKASEVNFKKAFGLCERRGVAAILVTHQDPEHLKTYIAHLVARTVPKEAFELAKATLAMALSGDEAEMARNLVGPCPNYKDLRSISELTSMAEQFEPATSDEGLKEIEARINVFRLASRELLAGTRLSIKELQKAHEGHKAAAEQSLKDKADLLKRQNEATSAGSSKAKKKKGTAASVLDLIAAKNLSMQSFDCKAAAWKMASAAAQSLFGTSDEIADAEPYVLRGIDVTFAESETSEVGKSLAAFAKEFKTSDLRRTQGRCMRRNCPMEQDPSRSCAAADDFLRHKLQPLMPVGSVLSPDMSDELKQLSTACALFDYGVKAHSIHASVEKESLWTARLGTAGTRSVAVFRSSDVESFMAKAGIKSEPKAYLRDLREQGLELLMQSGCKAWHTTVAKGDMLFVPSHTVILEEVMSEDCHGLRWSCVLPRDKAGAAAFAAQARLAVTPAAHVSKAVATLLPAGEAPNASALPPGVLAQKLLPKPPAQSQPLGALLPPPPPPPRPCAEAAQMGAMSKASPSHR